MDDDKLLELLKNVWNRDISADEAFDILYPIIDQATHSTPPASTALDR